MCLSQIDVISRCIQSVRSWQCLSRFAIRVVRCMATQAIKTYSDYSSGAPCYRRGLERQLGLGLMFLSPNDVISPVHSLYAEMVCRRTTMINNHCEALVQQARLELATFCM